MFKNDYVSKLKLIEFFKDVNAAKSLKNEFAFDVRHFHYFFF